MRDGFEKRSYHVSQIDVSSIDTKLETSDNVPCLGWGLLGSGLKHWELKVLGFRGYLLPGELAMSRKKTDPSGNKGTPRRNTA